MIEVALSGWDGSLEAKISSFDFVYEPETDGGRLIFSVDNPERELTNIIATISSNECHIHEVKINKASLEDVFVATTGRGIND
jgi:ABC-type multidrug transport system ATPase subunit